ncbi:tRNA (adenosine(37)-N6)-threonylcarbamoyltransferase complex dimerization subunit type 1 TsaB [Gulosibacter bifidus]|uniref:tRNA (Adenosine(37)-N6)-threonylcarbamoyltransferase complex dimerization subunit type 1 TsaB n=1 Tax=Gulosibacter bifidus TaxID=272239 RepID=A0ABW5RJ47_9MICO|nr:tRNA (adenosine(37)-N6)-threonylcarbamoyltransferase complex dimerization subunit type 1 TsaB [Gulosibacter bifidus]
MLLAIDTSAGTDIALVDDGNQTSEPAVPPRILAEYREANPRHHAEVIGVGIEAVLLEAGISAGDITEVVCGMGPGPFTGLRVGVAAARTYAFARGVPLRAMPSHDAIAHEWRAAHPSHTGVLVVTTDARRRELALTRYEAGELRGSEFALIAPDAVADSLRGAEHVDASQISAAHLALAWCDRVRAGLDAEADEILYSRAPDAKPGAVPKRVSGK